MITLRTEEIAALTGGTTDVRADVCGVTIDSWMNLSSGPRFALAASAFRLSRSGPTVPVAPADFKVWHPPHPNCWKTASPGGPLDFPPLLTQVANALPVRIVTWLRMSAWPRPQSSVQITGNVPVLVGVTTIVLICPGTASCFCDSSGDQNEWMTSFAVMFSFT